MRTPVISLGAGVQSSAMLLMAAEGELLHLGEPRLAIFADTGWETPQTYEWLGFLRMSAWKAGIEVATVSAGSLKEAAIAASHGERWASMPLYLKNLDGTGGILNQQCSKEYKIAPARREMKARGITYAEPWLGITVDEIERVSPGDVQWARNRHPLVELEMRRSDCERWLRDRGYPMPPKSACIACPWTNDARWFDRRENHPEEWAEAVAADRLIRHLPNVKAECFLHRSRVPLEEAILDPSDYGQGSLMSECGGACFV